MARRYLISAKDLTDNGFIHGNTDTELVSNLIFRVQETEIQPILGTKLYEKLLDLVEAADGDPLEEPYETLMRKYVVKAVIPFVEKRATTHLNWKMKAKSVGTASDEWHKASTKQETTDLKNELGGDAAHYRNLLIEYLLKNKTDFAEYTFGDQCVGYNPEGKQSSVNTILFVKGGRYRRHYPSRINGYGTE